MSSTTSRVDARAAAFAIRQIAADRNLLRLGSVPNIPNVGAAYEQSVGAFSEEVTTALEKQAITAVGFNQNRNTVFIYTSRKVSKAQEKTLPFNIAADVKVAYRQLRPLVITDTEADDVFGAEPYSTSGKDYNCGSSISPGTHRSAGTLGAIVEDEQGVRYGLTNNHVTGGCNNTRVGLPIVAPGIMDVQANFHDPFTIGWHHSVLPMRQGDPNIIDVRQNTDAALFLLNQKAHVTSSQGGLYPTPTEVIDPIDDMRVEKFGRTTQHTTGIIEAEVAGELPVNYKSVAWHSPSESTSFQGQVFFAPVFLIRGDSGPFSSAGDSGSLVVTAGTDRKAVGLIFAGRAPDVSYMLPLKPILAGFGVKLVS